jgi:FKBP-type peptidyl-prolyl cis-trans isomerase
MSKTQPPFRSIHAAVLCVISVAGVTQARATSPAAAQPSATAPGNVSYQTGMLLGEQLQHNGLAPKLSIDELMRGLKDGLAGHALTTQERETTLHFMRDAHEALADSNRAAARKFLERNAKEPGIHTTPTGLQYRVLVEGAPHGKSPAPTDQVTVRYRASLSDGTEFDRSDTHDRPATFRVNSVFKAWQEAFQAMKPGAKWQLFVPPELGYGTHSPPSIPPGALLVYELELLRVEPAAPVAMPGPQH